MKKIVYSFSTEVILENDEPKTICKAGQGKNCCAFLICGGGGFRCVRMDYPLNGTIFDKLEKGEMKARGKGGWKGCAWEGEGKKTQK